MPTLRSVNAPHPRRRTRPTTIIMAIAATSILAIGALTLAWAYGWGLGNNRAPTETQVECSTIVHAHQTWLTSATRLNNNMAPTEVDMKQTKDDGDAYFRAVNNRADAAAKDLAVKVAAYNLELGTFTLPHDLGAGGYDMSGFWKTANASTEVVTAYDRFRHETCTGTEYSN